MPRASRPTRTSRSAVALSPRVASTTRTRCCVTSLAVAAAAIALHYGRAPNEPRAQPTPPHSPPSPPLPNPPPQRMGGREAPSESELRAAVSPQELFVAWQKCHDVQAYATRCPQLAGLCTDAGGATVRRICSRTCGTCLGTTDGRLHAQEAELVRALDALGGAAGAERAEPTVTVLRLGAEQTPLLVIDNFLPPAAVRAAAMAASESQLWQPPRPDVARHWASPEGRGSPRDARGLFAPPGMLADTFPGLIAPLHAAYERQMWAQLRGLGLEEQFDAILEAPLQGAWRLHPHVPGAATPRAGGCNPTCRRLQPHVPGAATPRAGGCNPTCRRLQPCVLPPWPHVCRRMAHRTLLRARLLLARALAPRPARPAHRHELRATAGDDPLPHPLGHCSRGRGGRQQRALRRHFLLQGAQDAHGALRPCEL